MTLVIKYNDLFDDVRPDVVEILKGIPSGIIIGMMAAFNDTLRIKGNTKQTQLFILVGICHSLDESDRNQIMSRAMYHFDNGYKLFGFPFTVELINREYSHFKSNDTTNNRDDAQNTLSILKAYLSVVDEITDNAKARFDDDRSGLEHDAPHLQLMWPHLLRQNDFINNSDVFYETQRGYALMEFLESHPKYGQTAKDYFKSFDCNSGYEYLTRILAIVLPDLQRVESPKPADFIFIIRLSEFQPVLKSLTIEPDEIRNDKSKQLDYRGMKERPLFEIRPNELIVPYFNFLYTSLFNGIIFSFYKSSNISTFFEKKKDDTKSAKQGFDDFKTFIGQEFTEPVLFRGTMNKCFGRKHEVVKFFENKDEFNPDCYYRRGNNIFIIEFKDNLLSSEVIQSGSYKQIRDAIDAKFADSVNPKTGKTSKKGVHQLARNIEWLAVDDEKFWMIDYLAANKKLKLRKMTLHPIIVQTNIYFDLPGINDYLDEKIQARLNPVRKKFKSIEPFTLINFNYFFHKLLLFSNSQIHLENELKHYHTSRKKLREKVRKNSGSPESMNNLLESYSPFSFIDSPDYTEKRSHKRNKLLEETHKIWNIKIPKDLPIPEVGK